MSFKYAFVACAVLSAASLPAQASETASGHNHTHSHTHGNAQAQDTAETIMISDAYARAATPSSKSGAAFMQIVNHGEAADRLVSASSDVAKRVELHTHAAGDDGVMRMLHVEEGFDLPAGGMLALERGGKHVMLMGLTRSLDQGDVVTITLEFEKSGPLTLDVLVDLTRKADGQGHGSHGGHGSNGSHGSQSGQSN